MRRLGVVSAVVAAIALGAAAPASAADDGYFARLVGPPFTTSCGPNTATVGGTFEFNVPPGETGTTTVFDQNGNELTSGPVGGLPPNGGSGSTPGSLTVTHPALGNPPFSVFFVIDVFVPELTYREVVELNCGGVVNEVNTSEEFFPAPDTTPGEPLPDSVSTPSTVPAPAVAATPRFTG
jgi:hypothetical protein